MIRMKWQGQEFDVRRIVLRRGHRDSYEATLSALAERLKLAIDDDASDPRPGDFWVGCHPRAGWGDADPNRIGWASVVEVPLAVGLLRATARDAIRSTRIERPTAARDLSADVSFTVTPA